MTRLAGQAVVWRTAPPQNTGRSTIIMIIIITSTLYYRFWVMIMNGARIKRYDVFSYLTGIFCCFVYMILYFGSRLNMLFENVILATWVISSVYIGFDVNVVASHEPARGFFLYNKIVRFITFASVILLYFAAENGTSRS